MDRSKAEGVLDDKLTENGAALFKAFLKTIAELLDPQKGCPWDRKQTHGSLRRYMIEEAYEAAEALGSDESGWMVEELGDVLLQVVLNSHIATVDGRFSIIDVIGAIDRKMRSRHPHVFERLDTPLAEGKISAVDLRKQWERIKAGEKKSYLKGALFDTANIPKFPASLQAFGIGKISERIEFDFDSVESVFRKLESEIDELKSELNHTGSNPGMIRKELGDIYFTLAQVCRHLELDPEVVAQEGNIKFLKRFQVVERLAEARGIDLRKAPMECKEALWQKAKELETS